MLFSSPMSGSLKCILFITRYNTYRLLRVPRTARISNQSIVKEISTLNTHWKNWCWSWRYNNLFNWYNEPTLWKDHDAEKEWGWEEKEATQDEMVGWCHWLSGHESEPTLGDSEGRGTWHAAVHGVYRSVAIDTHVYLQP